MKNYRLQADICKVTKKTLSIPELLLVFVMLIAVFTGTAIYAQKVESFEDSNKITLSESSEYIDGRVLIKYHKKGLKGFTSDLTLDGEYFSEFRETGVRLNNDKFLLDDEFIWYEAKIKEGTSVEEALRLLKKEKNIATVEPVYVRTAAAATDGKFEVKVPNDKLFAEQTYLDEVHITEARQFLAQNNINPGGSEDVVVAVIDTGVDYTHEDLVDSMWKNVNEIPGNNIDDDNNGYVDDVYGYSTYASNGDPKDHNGHGTHVAGIIAAQNNNRVGIQGVAYNTKIMAIQASSSAGVFTTTAIVEAIKYAVLNGADVINMSFGGTQYSVQEEDALQAAYNKAVLVAAAGNNHSPNEPKAPDFFPAAYESVIGVMASAGNNIAPFSNYDYIPNDLHEYEIVAPGYNIMSTLPNNQYRKWSGTSMAAPVVSGIAALLRSYFADKEVYNTRFISDQITRTGDHIIGTMGCITYHDAFDLVNAFSALTKSPIPDLVITDYYVFDDPSIDAHNDGDGAIDAGETVHLGVKIFNRWGKTINTKVALDTKSEAGVEDPYIQIIKGNIDLGQIGAGQVQTNGITFSEEGIVLGVKDPLIIKLAEDTPNDTIARLRFYVTANNGYDLEDKKTYEYELYANIATRNGTEIQGVLKEDTVLTNDRLWIISNALTIPEGITLTVEEGTTVQFWTNKPMDAYANSVLSQIVVRGSLIAKGTKDKPITFTVSDLYQDYAIQIYGTDNGIIELSNVNIENPRIEKAKYIDSCYFIQNGERVLKAEMHEGKVNTYYTDPHLDAIDISNSVFYALGDSIDNYYQFRITGNLYNNLFSCCRMEIDHRYNQYIMECNVFNNSSRSDGTYLQTKIYVGYHTPSFAVIDGIKNEQTGSGYLLVSASNYSIAKRFAKYVGGYMASINSAKEQEFIEKTALASKQFYIGLEQDSKTGKDIWADGTQVGYNNISNPDYVGHYTIMNGSTWSKVSSGDRADYYLIEIPTSTLIDDFKFAKNELNITNKTINYPVDIIVTPETGDKSTLVYESTNENVFVVSKDGKLTAVSEGTAKLKVKTNDNFAMHEITVNVVPEKLIQEFTVNTELVIPSGKNSKINPTITPADSTESLVYESISPNIASVDDLGNVTANEVGTTTIKVSNANKTIVKEIKVTVYIPISNLTYEQSMLKVVLGDEPILMPAPKVEPNNATNINFDYESTDKTIAYVDQEGKLITKTEGVCIIRAKATDGSNNYSEILVIVSKHDDKVQKFEKVVEAKLAYKSNNGEYYYLGLTTNGDVWIWGGGLKTPELTKYKNVADISCDSSYQNNIIFLYRDGKVTTGFDNNQRTYETLKNIKKIAANGGSYLALAKDNSIYGWGNNSYGQLCTGDTNNVDAPTIMANMDGIVDIALNHYSAFVLIDNGILYYSGGDEQIFSLNIYTGIEPIKFLETNGYYVNAIGNNYIYSINSSINTYNIPSDAVIDKNKISRNGDYSSIAYIDINGNAFGGNGQNRYGKFSSKNYNEYIWEYYNLAISNIDKIYNFNNNIFLITKEGKLYGTGLNSSYQLADLSFNNRSIPTELLFGLKANDNELSIIASNTTGVLDLRKGFVFNLKFSDAINPGSSFTGIRIITNTGALVRTTKEIQFNTLNIKLSEDILDATSININIPANAVYGKVSGAIAKQEISVDVLKQISISDFEIKESSQTLYKNTEYQLNTLITSENNIYDNNISMNRYITFESSNPNVVTVDRFGKIYAIKAGSAVITGRTYDGKITDTVNINVEVAVDKVEFDQSIILLHENETYQLKPIITPVDATSITYEYYSSEQAIAEVNQDGLVIAKQTGVSIITVNCNGKQTAVLISVIPAEYEEPVVEKVLNNKENYNFALTSDGKVYKWGNDINSPQLINENVKDIFVEKYGSYVVYVMNDGTIINSGYIQKITKDNVKSLSFCGKNILVIDNDNNLYVGSFETGVIQQVTNIFNLKEVCVGSNNGSFVGHAITQAGDLYRISSDGSYVLVNNVSNVNNILLKESYYLVIYSDNKIITQNISNSELTYDETNYYNYIKAFNSELYSISDSDEFAYVLDGILYYYHYVRNYGTKLYTYDAKNIKYINVTDSNLYYLTNDGDLYGLGRHHNNALTSMVVNDTYDPVKLYFGVSIQEEPLQLVSNNISQFRTFKANDILIFKFNQQIYLDNKTKASLNNVISSKSINIDVKVSGKELHIILKEDLVADDIYALIIREGTLKTYLGQFNKEINKTLMPLSDKDVDSIVVVENNIDMLISETKELNIQIKPSDLGIKYLRFEIEDPSIIKLDEIFKGTSLTNYFIHPLNGGSTKINIYNLKDQLLGSINVKVNVPLEKIGFDSQALLIKEGENKNINARLVPGNATDIVFKYTISDENIATIDEFGNVHALQEGLAIVTVIYGDIIGETIVSVVPQSYTKSKVVKVKSTNENGGQIALLEDGSLWIWGSTSQRVFKRPTKLNISNIKDFTVNYDSSVLHAINNDGSVVVNYQYYNVNSIPNNIKTNVEMVKIVNETEGIIALGIDNNAYQYKNGQFELIQEFSNIIDIESIDGGNYFLLANGSVVRYMGKNSSETYILQTPVAMKGFIEHTSYGSFYALGVDNKLYQISGQNCNLFKDSPVVDAKNIIIRNNNYIYIKDNKVYNSFDNVIEGFDNPAYIWKNGNGNDFCVTKDGELYGRGDPSGYNLTEFITENQYRGIKIEVESLANDEKPLEIVENNIKDIRTFKANDKIIFTFNQKIYLENKFAISINDGVSSKTINQEVSVDNNKLIITLKEDLVLDTIYTLTIRNNAVRTYLGQYNVLTSERLYSYNTKDVTSVVATVKDVTINSGEVYSIEYAITPEELNVNYIYTVSDNEDVFTYDLFANHGMAHTPGTAHVNFYNLKDELLETVTITVKKPIQSIEFEEKSIVIKNGETVSVVPKLTPLDTTDVEIKYSISDKTIATVDQDGNVKALKEGLVVLTATNKGLETNILISVVPTDYIAPKVVKIKGVSDNSIQVALLDDGTVWSWGINFRYPTKLNLENVKDFTINYNNDYIDVIYNDGTVGRNYNYNYLNDSASRNYDLTNITKITNQYNNYTLALDNNFNAYYYSNYNFKRIEKYNNVIDIESSSYGNYLLLSNGDLIIIDSYGNDTLIQTPCAIKGFFEHTYRNVLYALGYDNKVYLIQNDSCTYSFDSPVQDIKLMSIYNSNYYMYIKNNKVYNSSNDVIEGFENAISIFNSGSSNKYAVNDKGELYGLGSSSKYALTGKYNEYQNKPVKINIVDLVNEELNLEQIENNLNLFRTFKLNDEIIYTFNQRIFLNNRSLVSLRNEINGLNAKIDVRIENNKLIIKLEETLNLDENYVLSIREGAIKTYLEQQNQTILDNIMSLRENDIESIVVTETNINIDIDKTKVLTYAITPTDLSNRYLRFEVENPKIVSYEFMTDTIKPLSGGTTTINIYNLKDVLLETVTVNVRVPLVSIDFDLNSLIVKNGESLNINAKLNPVNTTEKDLVYRISDETIATIDQSGNVHALKEGIAIVTVNLGNIENSILISVIPGDFVEPKFIKVVSNNNDHYALTDDGKVYSWGNNYKTPTIVKENVKDVFAETLSNNVVYLLDGDIITNNTNSFNIYIPNMKYISSYGSDFIALSNDGKVYIGNFDANTINEVPNINGAVEVNIGANNKNNIGHIITNNGNLYEVAKDLSTKLIVDVTNAMQIINNNWDYSYIYTSDNKCYKCYIGNYDNWTYELENIKSNPFNYPIYSVSTTNGYAYINNEGKLYYYHYNENNDYILNEIELNGLQVASLNATRTNLYIVTTDGKIYGLGSASSNGLTNINNKYTLVPTNLNLGVSIKEDKIVSTNNLNTIKTFKTNNEIIYTFNQKIYLVNATKIRLINESTKLNEQFNVRVDNNKLIITLKNDLECDVDYSLIIRDGAVKTFLGQFNKLINDKFISLREYDATDVIATETNVTINVDTVYTIDFKIIPEELNTNYIKVVSDNPELFDYSFIAGHGYANRPGTVHVNFYNLKDELLETVTITIVAPLMELKYNQSTVNIKNGETISLVPSLTPEFATDVKLTYSTSDETIASVDELGNVHGIKEGLTVLTAKSNNGLTAEILISVIPIDYVSPKVIKVRSVGNQTGQVALLEDGTLWVWGQFDNTTISKPKKLNVSNVKDFATNYDSRSIDVIYNDGTVGLGLSVLTENDAPSKVNGLVNIVKLTSEYGNYIYALDKNHQVYYSTGSTFTLISDFNNVIDIESIDHMVLMLLSTGDVIKVTDGATFVPYEINVPIKQFVEHSNWSNLYALGIDNSIYQLNSNNSNTAVFNSPVTDAKDIAIYSSSNYIYTKNNKVYNYNGNEIKGFNNPVSLWANSFNYYCVDTNGILYGYGSNDYTGLTDKYKGYQYSGVEINIDDIVNKEKELYVMNTNLGGAHEYVSGSEIIVEFNQPIYKSDQFSRISIYSGTKLATFNKRIEGNKLIVTLLSNLEYGVTYSINIPEDSVCTYLGQGNKLNKFDLVSLVNIDITNIQLDSNKIEIQKDTKQTIAVNITPSTATNRYLAFESDDTNIATVDEFGTITAKNNGVCHITISYLELKLTLEVKVFETINNIIVNEEVISGTIGENKQFSYDYTNKTATKFNFITYSTDETIVRINENGTIDLVGEGIANIIIKDTVTNITSKIIVLVNSKDINNSKVVKIASTRVYTGSIWLEEPYVLLEDGTIWTWGFNHKLPTNITPKTKSKIIDFYLSDNNSYILVKVETGEYYVYSISSSTLYHSYDRIDKLCCYSNELYGIIGNKVYDLINNNVILTSQGIVDFYSYGGNYMYINDKGLVYSINSGNIIRYEGLTNIIGFIESKNWPCVISADGTTYKLSNSSYYKYDSNLLDIYKNIQYIDNEYYGVVDNKIIGYYSSYNREGLNVSQFLKLGNAYYVIDTLGNLLAIGSNYNNAFSYIYSSIEKTNSYLKIYFGHKTNKLEVIDYNMKGVKKYNTNDQLIIEFNQSINDYNLATNLTFSDINNNPVGFKYSIDKNKLIVTLTSDLTIGNSYVLSILKGAVDTLYGVENKEETFIFECNEPKDDINFEISNEKLQAGTDLNSYNLNINTTHKETIGVTIDQNIDMKYLLFNSDNISVANITNNGVISGYVPGTANITISNVAGTLVKTIKVTVDQEVSKLILEDAIKAVNLTDKTLQLNVKLSPNNITKSNIIWESSDTTIATVDNGLVTFVSKGVVEIQVKDTVSGITNSTILFINEFNANDFKVVDVESTYYTEYYLLENGQVWKNGEYDKKPVKTNFTNVKQIAAYNNYLLVLTNDNRVFLNDQEITSLQNIIKIDTAAFGNTYYALDSNGTLWGWGYENSGSLGINNPNNNEYYSEPLSVFALADEKVIDFFGCEKGIVLLTDKNQLYYYSNLDNSIILLNDYSNVTNIYYNDHMSINDSSVYMYFKSNNKYYKFNLNDYTITNVDAEFNKLGNFTDLSVLNSITNNIAYILNNNVYLATNSQNITNNYSNIDNPKLMNMSLLPNEVPSKVIYSYYNLYVITSLGRLFACGGNGHYELVDFTTNKREELKEISFTYNDSKDLQVTTNINNGDVNVKLDSPIVLTFNQPISSASLRGIKLTCDGKLVVINSEKDLNKIIIKPLRLLESGKNYTITIPQNIIKNLYGIFNKEMIINFTTETVAASGIAGTVNDQIRIDYSTEGLNNLTTDFINGKFVSNYAYNSFLNNFHNTNMDDWIRIYTNEGDAKINFAHNYWGTTDIKLIKKCIIDQDNYAQYNDIIETPFLTDIPESKYPFVTSFEILDENGLHSDFASAGKNYAVIKFNTDMDTTQDLGAFFGPSYPYTDFLIDGEWVNSRTWKGTFNVHMTTGDGIEHLLVMDATSAQGYKMTKDFRFVFKISSIGAESLELFAEAKKDGINLNWQGNDDELAIGYNIYRQDNEGQKFKLVNDTLIDINDTTFVDKTVLSNHNYKYTIAVVYSDLSENRAETLVDIKSLDNTLPVIAHTPIYSLEEGSNLIINAECTDNNGISSVKLYYRVPGEIEYKFKEMISYNNDNTFSASIIAKELTIKGIQYYIECMDIEGNVTTYRNSNNPVPVSIIKASTNITPVITSLSKYSGHISGGEELSIFGQNFEKTSKVLFNGIEVKAEYINSGMLKVITPSVNEECKATIIVENANGEIGIKVDAYTYYKDNSGDIIDEANGPKIYYLSENKGFTYGGNLIILYGNNFTENTKVYFDNIEAKTIYVSDLVLYVYVPIHSLIGKVDVEVKDGPNTFVKHEFFEYVLSDIVDAMRITALSDKSGLTKGGNKISIYGNRFTEDTEVYFNELVAETKFMNATHLIVTVPEHKAGTVSITVKNSTEQYLLENAYTYFEAIVNNDLSILALSNNSGLIEGGNKVTIYGNNFTKDMKVFFGENNAEYVFVNETQILVTVPQHEIGEVDVKLENTINSTVLEKGYKYIEVIKDDNIIIYGISNSTGIISGGNIINIYGNNFTEDTKVYFGSELASLVKYISTTQLMVTVPAHEEGIVDIKVENNINSVLLEDAYSYIDLAISESPAIVGLSQTVGYTVGGSLINLYGNKFTEDMQVFFGEVEAEVTFINATQVAVKVPANNEGIVSIKVVNSKGQSVKDTAFTYISIRDYNIKLNAGIDTIIKGFSWIDSGISSDYPLTIKTSGYVDINTVGKYIINYECYDNGLLIGTLTRVVHVIENTFEVNISVNAGITTVMILDQYVDSGATCNVGNVTVDTSRVDTTKVGVYEVIYSIEYQGVTYSKVKYVHVIGA